MSARDDGGAAFPKVPDDLRNGSEGMTLRDWFAGKALASGYARDSLPAYDLTAMFGKLRTGITREEIIAADAYRLADAMLAERSK